MKLMIFIILSVLLIQIVNAQEYGDIIIKNETIWKNQIRVHAGNIIINSGGNLTIDHTTIYFKSSHSIAVAQDQVGGKLTIQNSYITTTDSTSDSTMWTAINVDYRGKLNISDTVLERFNGTANIGRYGHAAINYYKPSANSYIENVTFTKFGCYPVNGASGIFAQEIQGTIISIKNSTFEPYQGECTSNENYPAIHYINSNYVGSGLIVENNFFNKTSEAVQTNGVRNVRIYNNTIFEPGGGAYQFHKQTIDSYAGYNHITYVSGKYSYVTEGCNTGCTNITIENEIINGVVTPSKLAGFANLGNTNVTFRNIVGTNISHGFSGSGTYAPINNLFYLYNNSVGIAPNGYGFDLPLSNSLIYDNIFYMMPLATSSNPCIASRLINGVTYPFNNTYTNNTLNGCGIGIKIDSSSNITFIDTFINAKNTDISFEGNNLNIKFINTKVDPSKVRFSTSTDPFNNYYYSDILVQDVNDNPISGATITTANEINSSYTSIDRTGASRTTFTTESDGHTKLPKGNDSETVVLIAYSQNKN